jgi:threonine/homoserine/homoserine lactone efflux protein
MNEIEPIWWLRIIMGAILLGMIIFAWCEISKARSVKRYYDAQRKAFDAQCAAALLVAAVLKALDKPNEPKNPEE